MTSHSYCRLCMLLVFLGLAASLTGCPGDDDADIINDDMPTSDPGDGDADSDTGNDATESDDAVNSDDSIANSDGTTNSDDDGANTGDTDTLPDETPTPIVVNSGATAEYSLPDGASKLFYFDAEAGSLYTVSGLSGISLGYVSTSPDVSASQYDYVTDATAGVVSFRAETAERYYVRVVADGGGASGWFQVADGGARFDLGTNIVQLTPTDDSDGWFFHFPVQADTAYRIQVSGTTQDAVRLSVAPRAERHPSEGFLYGAWGASGPLPMDDTIEAASVNLSLSGYYFLWIRVYEPTDLTITLSPL